MQLIHFQGLNCYHDCVISIVNHLGVNYPAAFSTLWSETDFRYDPYREAFLTKRMITNLEALGAKVEGFDCFSAADAHKYLSRLHGGEFAVIGADAFYIPWNQFYRTFHGPHYFIIQHAETEMRPCFDPTYNKQNEQISYSEIIKRIFDISLISRVEKKLLNMDVKNEAKAIIRAHPDIHEDLISKVKNCVSEPQKNIILLAKYIDAMISNRYLYRYFLENCPPFNNGQITFLSNNDFMEWKSVKNGLYKAAISKNNNIILADICETLERLIVKETALAEKIGNVLT